MTKDIELKAIDELIYEIEMFEQAGVYPNHDFIENLKTLAAKVKEETKLEGCVVVPVEPTDAWMANYIDSGVEKYCEQFIGQKFAVTEKEKPAIKEEWRNPVRKAHALVLKVVEAARGGNE